MKCPAERSLDGHMESVDFRIGEAEGRWGEHDSEHRQWPFRIFWVQGPTKRFFFRFDFENYPTDGPTGSFWDLKENQFLAAEKRPTARGWAEKVFRADWEQGRALYHPFDRTAAQSHPDWSQIHVGSTWSERHTVVDLLELLYELLNQREVANA